MKTTRQRYLAVNPRPGFIAVLDLQAPEGANIVKSSYENYSFSLSQATRLARRMNKEHQAKQAFKYALN